MKSIDRIYAFIAAISLASCFLLSSAPPLLPNLRPPPPMVMASDLPASCYQSENDLRVLRKAIGWQSPGYDSKMQHGMLSLTQPGAFVYFSSYTLAGLMSPLSSFFLMLLEHYGLQLQHLSPHSITLVAVFTHFCKMFVGVRPSVRLFQRFHVLRPVNKQPPRLAATISSTRRKILLSTSSPFSPIGGSDGGMIGCLCK
jgi:hypothetical protein